eukprot:3021517-Rhodomonas_salina.1
MLNPDGECHENSPNSLYPCPRAICGTAVQTMSGADRAFGDCDDDRTVRLLLPGQKQRSWRCGVRCEGWRLRAGAEQSSIRYAHAASRYNERA